MGIKIEVLKQESKNLETRMNEIEQYSRKRNVTVYGIFYEQNEKIKEVTQSMANKIKVIINDYDTDEVHRLPSKKGIPAIILCVNNLTEKDQLINWSKTSNKEETFGYKVCLGEKMIRSLYE